MSSGHFGDPLALPNGNCEACSCYPPGTEQTDKGVSVCEQLSGKFVSSNASVESISTANVVTLPQVIVVANRM